MKRIATEHIITWLWKSELYISLQNKKYFFFYQPNEKSVNITT